ncbi:MAG: inositol-3-phosphate synthase [Pirellulales bacterium]|jgi:myo-inositol-1-phosphate synthase
MARSRIGIWLIGAKGGVATTAIVGLVALKKGLTDNHGLVSQLPQFDDLGLADWKEFVIGGHEIRDTTLYAEANKLVDESRAIDGRIVEKCKNDLNKIDANIKDGTLFNVGKTINSLAHDKLRKKTETPRDAIKRIQRDLRAFVKDNKLTDLVVMNVSSTEPTVDESTLPQTWSDMNKQLDKPRKCLLPASSLYGIATLELGYTYLNFTPSLGTAPKAICELAENKKACHMGHDGKTGETLMKSALAPMFAKRNLEVMSWVGHNIFGNMDAQVLDDPENKKTKATSKDRLLGQIFGYQPETLVTIEKIDSMGDWKTAWDHIHFKGFLGTPMTLQFTWQGCDSLLAAPLVIDLIRFGELAHRHGEVGLLTSFSCFFKSPLGTEENDFGKQFAELEAWADKIRGN